MSRKKTYGFSFSWKRALGISAFRGKIARATGIPTTKSGLQRKLGRSALGIGAGIATGAVAATVANQTINSHPTSQPQTKKKTSCLTIGLGVLAVIAGIAVCGSLLSQVSGGGNSTSTPTNRMQAQVLNSTSKQIPTLTKTSLQTLKPTITSTPYPPGFRPTDTRWPTATEVNVISANQPISGGGGSTPVGVDPNNPTGATALCRDGTLSYSQHHSGTCSNHDGVAVWYK